MHLTTQTMPMATELGVYLGSVSPSFFPTPWGIGKRRPSKFPKSLHFTRNGIVQTNPPVQQVPKANISQLAPLHNQPKELLRIKATWPFDFFPNELVIYTDRIIYHERFFVFDNASTTISITNIVFCEIINSMLFAQLILQDKFGDRIAIKWLHKTDAHKVKELIDHMMMQERPTQTSDDDTLLATQLKRILEMLGKDN